ncbi:histidine phosphatase family protein [Mastigocoleus sp. MO_188.B34]|uniref:histidine phosphatase family protein n=1 Tax=Mastigocoleus sp. MO_188.B34 TaxID=3036635 RepID=UPI00261B95B7|nr:histidine phosphatase family protein [Mastigocoleus sp. MO_188.B34]MDJ0695071.1 histidine phosphatase family protein [Mastigocoleus sp. MO_188.B34]
MPSEIKEDSKTRIILLRHGESTYNRLELYQGSCNDSVLTTNGILDAQHTGIYLAELGLNNKNLDLIYSSSLRRSYDTAQEIAQAIANTFEPKIIHTSDLLWETDLPQWRGLGIKYVRKNFPEEYHTWKHSPQDFFMESIEGVDNEVDSVSRFYPLIDLYSKIRLFWQDLLRNHFGQTILVIAHGGSNRALISIALGIEPKRYHCIQQSNCGISVLQFSDNSLGSGRLEAMNLNSHMGYTMPKLQEGAGGIRLLLVSPENNLVKKHKLISCLRDVILDFSILEESNNCFETGRKILKYHPATSQISANSPKFLQYYTNIIKKRLQISTENKLSNGLVVAELETIKKLIGNILGMSCQNLEKLNLQPGTISAIHYPSVELPPVLQAMNTSESEKYLIYKPEFAQSYLF